LRDEHGNDNKNEIRRCPFKGCVNHNVRRIRHDLTADNYDMCDLHIGPNHISAEDRIYGIPARKLVYHLYAKTTDDEMEALDFQVTFTGDF